MHHDFTTADLAIIQETTDTNLPWTWSYVLSALEIPHRIISENHISYLLVPTSLKAQALREIEEYLNEAEELSPEGLIKNNKEEGATLQPPTLLLMGSLVIIYAITGPWNQNSVWFQKGAGDSQAILEHSQWFRLVTALTLHANGLHLLNNCVLGGLLLDFFLLLVGTGVGLFALLLASVAGNGINVFLHGDSHLFVGFSTAIFAVIGMLAILSYKNRDSQHHSRIYAPLMGAFALLAMLGSAGEHTDLGAHFFGLLSGLLTGKILVLPVVKNLRRSFYAQSLLFLLSLSIFVLSWLVAFERY